MPNFVFSLSARSRFKLIFSFRNHQIIFLANYLICESFIFWWTERTIIIEILHIHLQWAFRLVLPGIFIVIPSRIISLFLIPIFLLLFFSPPQLKITLIWCNAICCCYVTFQSAAMVWQKLTKWISCSQFKQLNNNQSKNSIEYWKN